MTSIDPTAVGIRIKEVRGNMTQTELAALLSAGRVSIARYESGARTPDAEFLVSIHRKLGVDPIWLLTGVGSGPAPELRLRDGEATLIEGYRALDARGRAGVMALISGMAPHGGMNVQVNGGSGHVVGHVVGPLTVRAVKAPTRPRASKEEAK